MSPFEINLALGRKHIVKDLPFLRASKLCRSKTKIWRVKVSIASGISKCLHPVLPPKLSWRNPWKMLVRTLPSYWNGPLSGDIFIFGDVNLTKSTYLERQISIHFSWNTANDVETSNHLLCFKEVPQWLLEVSETVNSYLLVGLYGPCTPSTSQKLRIVAWIEKCGDVETPQDLETLHWNTPRKLTKLEHMAYVSNGCISGYLAIYYTPRWSM